MVFVIEELNVEAEDISYYSKRLGGIKKRYIGLDKIECCRIIRSQEQERCDNDQLDAKESKRFWGDIWSESVDHNRDAKWLKDLQSEVNVYKTGEGRYSKGKFEEDL